jgi:hypothetical protein
MRSVALDRTPAPGLIWPLRHVVRRNFNFCYLELIWVINKIYYLAKNKIVDLK